ncbi:MAG TPA: adenylate/guanylate cyclase domain-containing protein, partial [Pseudomonadota bacterium]|nr:adenylate/guanylate cyclase domain-containing protein [Pseudomonadota bacterium]
LHPPIAPVVGLCFLQFIRKYAHLPPRGEQLVKLSVRTLLVWTPIALLIDAAGNAALAATSVNFLSVICMALTMGSLLVGAYRGDRESLVLAISSGPSVIGISFLIGAMSGILPPGGLVDASMQIGVTTQVSLLGLALSDRIRRLRIDRDQAQAILRLTLPDVIADRLKAGEKYIADRHSRVAVLFADLAGFTPLSATHEPETIVQLLDALFREMDALARKVGAEKIKTIGDCYMVVAGAPSPHADPVAALADLALAIPEATERVMKQVSHLSYDLPERLSVRIGLHVGPVVAGVLGEQKLAYDLWGDTVNTASRMESHGVVGRVQCSQQVVEALSDRYEFEPRGDITIRGKGTLPVWLLVGKRAKPQDS